MDAPDDEWQHRLDTLREEHRIEREHDRLRHQEHALGLIIENEALRDKNRLLTKRTQRLKARVERLERAVEDAGRRERELSEGLAAVHASRTWRLRGLLARPARRS